MNINKVMSNSTDSTALDEVINTVSKRDTEVRRK
jgi:hypothetical protein